MEVDEDLVCAGITNVVPIPPMKGESLPTCVVKMLFISNYEHGVTKDDACVQVLVVM